MLPGGKELHQSVATKLLVQREGQPDYCRGRRYPETDTYPLPDARRVHDDEHHEHGKQPESKNKKVLGTESPSSLVGSEMCIRDRSDISYCLLSVLRGRMTSG